VCVHARTLHPAERFGHESSQDPLAGGHFLHDHPYEHDGVGHRHGVRVAKVYLVLARGVLVLAVLDWDAHFLEHEHGLAPQRRCLVVAHQLEVRPFVERQRGLALGVGRLLEVEVLQLGSDVEREPLVAGLVEHPAQDVARVSFEGRPVEVEDVAHDARNRGL
jgi:hypothetical protein